MVIILNFKSNYLAASIEKERIIMKTQFCSIAFEFLIIFLRNHTLFFLTMNVMQTLKKHL